MKKRYKYSYAILRYVHDSATSEFVNIGVAVHCQEESFFQVSCLSTTSRVSKFFPDLNKEAFRSLEKIISTRFSALSDAYVTPLNLEDKARDLETLLMTIIPKDDSALIWSPITTGLTAAPSKTLTDLYARYVTRYDQKPVPHKRTDDDIRRNFSRALENRSLSDFFIEKVIQGEDDEVTFKSAWKNGTWHCVEPISFDLSAADTIREKAHRFLGQITSISDSSEKFKMYLVLGPPSDTTLQPAFHQAVKILEKINIDSEIFQESQTDQLLELLQSKISIHLNESYH